MLKLTNVSKYYHSNDVVALGLRKVSLEFNLGEFVAVTGESGSGKSTLLNVISGLDTYEDGEMYVNKEETSYFSVEEWEGFRRQYIGFVFQNYNIIDSYSVLENVMLALIIQGYNQGEEEDIENTKNKRKARALELIEKVGLTSHVNHKASKLSGGQKQRCVIARALAKDCPIIVADEPTGNLDSESGKKIMALLQEISKDKLVIVVTHNYDQVKDYATRKIRLFDGEVVEDKVIKKHKEVTKESIIPSFSMNILDLMGISFRNLIRTPRRSIFTTIVTIFTVFIFVVSYGGYVESTSSSGSFYGGGYFNNVTESRIIVTKFENTPFTQSELDEIENIRLVRTIMEHDVILDLTINSYYDTGYDWISTLEHFVNPADMLKDSQLKKGSFPTSIHEVVIEELDGYDVGDTITLGYGYAKSVEGVMDIPEGVEFTITGVAEKVKPGDWRKRMYFHEDYINSEEVIRNAYLKGTYYYPPLSIRIMKDGNDSFYMYNEGLIIDNDILDDEISIASRFLPEVLLSLGFEYEDPISKLAGIKFQMVGTTSFEEETVDVEITSVFELDEEDWSSIAMNQNTLDKMLTSEIYQISVLVYDVYDANKVIEDIDDLGYNTIYPDGVTDQYSQIYAIFTAIYLGFILGLLLVVIYFITYVVLKNIQNSKKKDYLIFRSIGASQKDLNRVTIIELLYTTIFAYIITMALFVLNENFDTFMPKYLRYFTVSSYIIVLIMMLVLAVMLGRRFNKRIFSKSVITSLKQE